MTGPFVTVGITKEGPCPEDPKGVDTHIALVPSDVKRLVEHGRTVFVERGAGERLGFSDSDFRESGAHIQCRQEIYREKDLTLRIKGPAPEAIPEMRPGSTLFCMAHLPMYPDRKEDLTRQKVNVLAMEEVCAYPKTIVEKDVYSRAFAKRVLDTLGDLSTRDVYVFGYSERIEGIIRYCGRKHLKSLTFVPPNPDDLIAETSSQNGYSGNGNGHHNGRSNGADYVGNKVVFGDSLSFPETIPVFERLRQSGVNCFDLADFENSESLQRLVKEIQERTTNRPGQRQIENLHETGRAGARYGFELLSDNVRPSPTVILLGYGNVAIGALQECMSRGATVNILGRYHTSPSRIEPWLRSADLIINGALLPSEKAGKEYVVTEDHVRNVIRPGSALIDLIGGSPTDRSPVESVETCTFLSDPHFVHHGVNIASVFAWPNYYRPLETCRTYSRQIADVLLEPGGLINGIALADQGKRRALVLGPFDVSHSNSSPTNGNGSRTYLRKGPL